MRISDWSSDVCSSDLADALEQLGYQAESGPWRNFYLTGAKELREAVTQLPTPNTASPDIVRSMTPEMFFDYLGDRKSTRLTPVTNAHLVCRLLLEKKNKYYTDYVMRHKINIEPINYNNTIS